MAAAFTEASLATLMPFLGPTTALSRKAAICVILTIQSIGFVF
jgi:hypothetical protein